MVVPLLLLLAIFFTLTFQWLLSPYPSRGSDFYGAGTLLLYLPFTGFFLPSFIPYWGLGTNFISFPKTILGLIISFLHLFIYSQIELWKVYFWLVFLLSGVFMHLYLLRIAESPSISFFGAFTYMYIPYHLSESIAEAHGDLSLAYTLLPLLFLSYEELFMRANPRNIIISGIFTTFVILTHPQSFIILIAPFLAIYLLIKIVLEKPILKFVLKKSISLSTPVLSGLLLTMFWWLPYYSSINEFYNTSYNIEASLYYTANPLQALTLQAISTNIPNWGHFFGNTWEYMFSLTIPLMLAFSMYFIIRTHNKIGISMFVSYTVSLLFSLGLISPIPLYQYAFEYLPFFNSIRTPARFLFFTSFAAVVIICIGLKIAFNKFKFSKKKKFVIVVGLLLFIMVNSYTEVGLSFRTFPLPIPLLGSYFFLNNQPYGRIFTIPLNTWSQEPQQGTVINPMLWVFMYDKEILGVGAPNLNTRPVGENINF
ncbi:MAG: hypothetical protein QXV37_04280, partial [Candidatus Jordarchaeaceae archaeon]